MEEEPADSRSKSRSNSQKAQQRGPRRRDSHESRSTRDSRSRHQEEHNQYSPIDIRLPLPEFLSKLRDHSNPVRSRSFTKNPGSPMDDPTTCQNLPAPIPALVPTQATYEYPPHPTPNPDSCLTVQIPDGLKVISSINYGGSDCPPHLQGGPLRFNPNNSAQSQSWCDRIQFCQAHSNQVQSHMLDLSKRLRDRSIMNRASMTLGAKSVLIVAISVDTQSLETSSFRNRCEITRLCFGFSDIIMWNDDLSRRTQAIQKFVEWVKILRSVSEQFESVRLVFENVRSACLFVDFVYFVNLFSLLSSVVSTISILPDSPTMMERLITINPRVLPTLDFNICVIRCAMLRDILEGENQTDESQGLPIKFDHSLNSTKLWRQVINFEDIIILDVKFYSRSEECLEVVQVNVFNSEGSMLRQFSALPQTFHVKELAKEMGYLEIDGHYTCNGQPVVTLKVLLQNFVTYLNDITAKRNMVLCTYSLEAVIAPLLNNLEAKRLLGDFRCDKLGLLDLVSCTSLKSVGELISQSQSERDKDIILQALKNGWENDSDRLKSHIQPLHLMSISFGPDILFLDNHNIQQVTSSNRVMIQTEMQDCDDFKYLLKLPSIDQDWRVQSVSKVRGQSIQIVMGAKKSPRESQISSLGYLVPSFQDRITLANLRVIAHLLGPEKAHSFRTMELWNKLIPVLEVKNVVYPHLLGHQEARKTVKELSFSGNVPSKYEVLSLSLGFSNEDIHQFSISNVSNGRHLNISNQCHDVEQELVNQLGRGVPKIVIGHNVMDMLDVLPNTSQVVGVIELEWLLLPQQRQDFENQPSWGEVIGKHLGFDFPFFPAETADINFYTLEFLKNLPHVSVNDLCQNVKKYMLPRSICTDLRPRASNIFLLTDSKDPEDQASTSSTITVRPLGDLRSDASINEQPLDPSPVPIDSDSADSDEPFICLEQGSRRSLAAKGVGYLRFNLLILNLKMTVADNTSFATAMEAYLPAKNKSFLEFILPEGINNDTLTERGYTWDGSTWSLVQEGCMKLVRSESECLQKLKNFVETGFGPHQRFVLVIPCVEALNQFLMMLKRHNRLKNFFVACRGWLDVKGLIYLRVLSPRQYFVKALDLESSELFQLYEYADTSPLGHVRQVPNVIAKILKTFKDLDFYRQALPICLNVKPYNLVFVNARALRYSVDPQYESLSVIHAKNMTSGQTFQCAIEPYGVWDPNLIQDFGYKRDSDSWILEQNGKRMPCLSLLDAMINFLRFSCADSKNVKTILVCSEFKESLAHIFEIVEFMRANCIFFNEVIAIFELATYLCREKHYRFLTTEAILNHYQAKTQGEESQPIIPSSASDLEGQSEMILKCLALQAKEDSIAIEKMIAKFAHGWNSPAWNKLLKESNILMFQDHVFPVELASTVSVTENVPKLVPCQVAQPVISFSDRVFITLSHPMTNILVHERIEMCPDRPFDLKITCHGNPSELKKGSVIGLICRQDRFLSYERERKRNLEAISQERLQFYQSSSREDLQDADASGPIMEALEQKPDIRALNQPRPDSTKAVQETQGPKVIPVENTSNDTLPMELSAVATEKAPSCQKEPLIREDPSAIPEKDILPLSKEPLNAGEHISSCIKGKPLSPLVTPELEEKEVASTLKCNIDQDLGQVLDKFMAAKEDHQKQQQPPVTESSANVLTLNELQDKFYTLFEFPSFAPLMLSYIKWCCTTGNHVDEGIGDTIITHLVGMGCDSLDTLKDMFFNIDPWNEIQIRIAITQQFPSMETLMSKDLMEILLWVICHELGPKENPLPSEEENLHSPIEARIPPQESATISTNQDQESNPMFLPTGASEIQRTEAKETEDQSNSKKSSDSSQVPRNSSCDVINQNQAQIAGGMPSILSSIISPDSSKPGKGIRQKCIEKSVDLEKQQSLPRQTDAKDQLCSGQNVTSNTTTMASDDSTENSSSFFSANEAKEPNKTDKDVSNDGKENSILEIPLDTQNSVLNPTPSSPKEDCGQGPSTIPTNVDKPQSSKPRIVNGIEDSNNISESSPRSSEEFILISHVYQGSENGENIEEDYRCLPFKVEEVWKNIRFGKITSVSGDSLSILAFPSRIVGVSKREEKVCGKIIFRSSQPIDKLIGQTAITFPDKKGDCVAMFTDNLQRFDHMRWGFIAALDSYSRLVSVGFYDDDVLRHVETPYERVLGSFGHFVVDSCCLIHINSLTNGSIATQDVFVLLTPNPSMAVVKLLQVRKTGTKVLESFFHEAKFQQIKNDRHFCVMTSPLKLLHWAELNRKFIKCLDIGQDPQVVRTHCKTLRPRKQISIFFRTGLFLLLTDELSDERLVVKTISQMSPKSDTSNVKSNCLVFWHIFPPNSDQVSSRRAPTSPIEYEASCSISPSTSDPQPNIHQPPSLCHLHANMKTTLCRNSVLKRCSRTAKECRNAHNLNTCIKSKWYCKYFVQGYCRNAPCPFPHKSVLDLYEEYQFKVKDMIRKCEKCNSLTNDINPTDTEIPYRPKCATNSHRTSRKRTLYRDPYLEPRSKNRSYMPDFF